MVSFVGTFKQQNKPKLSFAGTFISARTKVAVFSGNSITSGNDWGQMLVQMPPLHTWGKEFTVMANTIG